MIYQKFIYFKLIIITIKIHIAMQVKQSDNKFFHRKLNMNINHIKIFVVRFFLRVAVVGVVAI